MQAGVEQIFGDYLRARGDFLCTAESCTGGLVGHLLTNVAGSSAYYVGGVIAYANEVKRRVLGVPQEILATYGAVSSQTAIAMAQGARQLFGSEFPLDRLLAISTTGIAGPSGATPSKPVGLVWIGFDSPRGSTAVEFSFHADRLVNKKLFAQAALKHALDFLKAIDGDGNP
jgi:PncC family amidohydrolase